MCFFSGFFSVWLLLKVCFNPLGSGVLIVGRILNLLLLCLYYYFCYYLQGLIIVGTCLGPVLVVKKLEGIHYRQRIYQTSIALFEKQWVYWVSFFLKIRRYTAYTSVYPPLPPCLRPPDVGGPEHFWES